jgi:hypothetical protein
VLAFSVLDVVGGLVGLFQCFVSNTSAVDLPSSDGCHSNCGVQI